MSATLEQRDGGIWAVRGELSHRTVPAVLAEGERLWANGAPRAVLDLGEVSRIDSAAVALLLEWRRQARAHGVELALRGVPPGMRSIASLCGVADLLPPEIESA